MRFVYRNRKVALFGLVCLFGVMMILIKYTEFSPTCLFREEPAKPVMLRDEVSCHVRRQFPLQFIHLTQSTVLIEIHGWKRSELLSISSTNATDIHWRCAKVGHNADACNAGRPSRCSVRSRDACDSTYSTVAVTLAEIREGKPSFGGGRNNERGML